MLYSIHNWSFQKRSLNIRDMAANNQFVQHVDQLNNQTHCVKRQTWKEKLNIFVNLQNHMKFVIQIILVCFGILGLSKTNSFRAAQNPLIHWKDKDVWPIWPLFPSLQINMSRPKIWGWYETRWSGQPGSWGSEQVLFLLFFLVLIVDIRWLYMLQETIKIFLPCEVKIAEVI